MPIPGIAFCPPRILDLWYTIVAMEKRNHHADPEEENYRRREKRWFAALDEYRKPSAPCPTLDDIRAVLARVKESAKAQRELGEMLLLLEQYEGRLVPQNLDNPSVMWKGGLRKFLSADPVLAKRYKTLMHYKNLAKKGKER